MAIDFCKKRNGKIERFDRNRIQNAISKAFVESMEGNPYIAKKVTESVLERVNRYYIGVNPSVEEIQDLVEETLIDLRFRKTAKCYILYREKKNRERRY